MRTFMIVVLLAVPMYAHAASFDCAKAGTQLEKLICSDRDLNTLDGDLGGAYKQALATAQDKTALKNEQKQWIKTGRAACGTDKKCLAVAYRQRIAALRPVPAVADSTGKLATKYSPEIIMKLLFHNAENKTGPKDKLTVKDWKYVPQSLVVLFSPEVQDKGDSDIFTGYKLVIAVLKEINGQLSVVARGEDLGERLRESSDFKLDLAAYEIGDKVFAFGIQGSSSYSSTSYFNASTGLTLYRVDEGMIVPILSVETASEHVDKMDESSPMSESKSIVIMDKAKTGGFYNILVKTTEKKDNSSGPDAGKSTTSTTTATYVWDGAKYVNAGGAK